MMLNGTGARGVLTWAAAVGLGASTVIGQVDFAEAVEISVGDEAIGVALVDFDGDGALDIAVANRADNNVIILRNVNGTFNTELARISFGALSRPVALIGADISGNGDADLLTLLLGADQVALSLNSGGVFAESQRFNTGDAPTAFALGDFDGDGIPDVVVSNEADDTLTLLLGDPDDVSFLEGVTIPVNVPQQRTEPRGVALGDFDGDGALDIVVALERRNQVGILFGNGDGTFEEMGRIDVGQSPIGVAVADFNGDGLPDIAVANSISDNVSILLNAGGGTFSNAANFPAGNFSAAIAVGDVDGDGELDVVTANGEGDNVSVLPGNGDGTFNAPLTFRTRGFPSSVALGDLDGDGELDIVTANLFRDTVSVLSVRGTDDPNDGDPGDDDDDLAPGLACPLAGPLAMTMIGLALAAHRRRRFE